MGDKLKEWPKLKGLTKFKASKGKSLPLFLESNKLVRIADSKEIEIDCDNLPYSAGNSLKQAIMAGDIIVCKASKGGK